MSSASTGGTEGSSPASSPASGTSLTMSAPKFGTLVPNRIFVGGIPASTSEAELGQVFSVYGNVKETKIISDRAGVSKGYGFVTFETEEEAKRPQQEAECIVLRERKLNIAPAIKKQPFSRSFDGSTGSPPSVPTSTYYYANGMGLPYQNGMTFYNTTPTPATSIAPPTDPGTLYQAAGVFGPQPATGHQTFTPVMYPCPPPSIYVPQQYQYSPIPYESYYAGQAATGAPQYVYATTGSSPSNASNGGGGNNSGSGGNNGTGATSPPTGPPPPLPAPHPTHFYAAAPPPHHHPPVPTGPPPPPAQMDHMYFSFAAGPPPPLPHAPMGMNEQQQQQQLLMYATDATCQQTSTSDGQIAPQEDSRPAPSHSEQPHGEAQAATGSPATPLVPLMPVKYPMSGRYHTNYHPVAMHAPHNAQNDSEDCTAASPLHCRTFVYHPAMYIPHAHAPPHTYHHNASGTASLLPTPFSTSLHQSTYDTNSTRTHTHNKDSSSNKYTGGQGNSYTRGDRAGQNHGHPLTHQGTHVRSQGAPGGSSHSSKCGGSVTDGGFHRHTTVAVSSRLPVPHNRRMIGGNMGSSGSLRSGGGYGSNHKLGGHAMVSNYGSGTPKPGYNVANNASQGFENGRGKNGCGDDQYYETNASNSKPSSGGGYGSSRKNCQSGNSYRGGAARLETSSANDSSNGRPNTDVPRTDSTVVLVVTLTTATTATTTTTTLSSRLSPAGASADAPSNVQEKPASPPPAPYSPMTQPLPTLSPPTPQVQFYTPIQNRYQQSSMPPSQMHQQQSVNQRSRYSVGQSLSSANRRPSDKYTNSGSQTTMLRQPKFKVNGIMQTAATTTVTGKLDDSLGGAGDGPGRLPITPPGTPRATGHPAAGDQNLSDTCHQMQALSL
ncbi:trithorax group protein osa isoform X2 [Ooceraea biroi]|uniref:trithorax group protein osa isoform X2 n=1 Tax=Ooceraea biroi TaxID=2015173 RepID=UPI0005B9510C|nr:trithorax group protein osa isoform X2 [Ooceraea biroi]